MRKIIIITITICFVTVVYTQNLVPNPYFDNDLHCPWNQCQIDFATGWSSYGSSPDYVHVCATDELFGVPNNLWGFQYPAIGDAYAQMFVFSSSAHPNIREHIGIELIEPLQIGRDYYVSFKTSLANVSRYAIKNLGVLFSTVSYSIEPEGLYTCQHDSVPLPPPNYAHIYSDEFISDTANWTTVSGWFTADSAYKYLIIGNFFDDDNTIYTVANPYTSYSAAHYFIDDVYVEEYPLIDVQEKKSNFKIDIYPNPIDDQTNIIIDYSVGINNINMKLFDIHGREVTNQVEIAKLNEKEYKIRRKEISNGFYILQIIINEEVINSKLLFD